MRTIIEMDNPDHRKFRAVASPFSKPRSLGRWDHVVEIGGRKLSEGERLIMFYASANRDESVFDAPGEFRVDRNPNPHLAFGIEEHFCIGAHLARKTTGALFAELLPHLESIEEIGEAERVVSNLVPGVKHLPMRYRIRARE